MLQQSDFGTNAEKKQHDTFLKILQRIRRFQGTHSRKKMTSFSVRGS